jgi:hypothetical protein
MYYKVCSVVRVGDPDRGVGAGRVFHCTQCHHLESRVLGCALWTIFDWPVKFAKRLYPYVRRNRTPPVGRLPARELEIWVELDQLAPIISFSF